MKGKGLIGTVVLVLAGLVLFAVSSAEAALCEQHDFGSASIQWYVYADGRTWEFTAENDMVVQNLEVKTVSIRFPVPGVPGVYFALTVQIQINGTLVASWVAENGTDIHSETVYFNLNVGDTITYRIYGGTMSDPGGVISGPNYVKLCQVLEGPHISISPTFFEEPILNVITSFNSPDLYARGLAFDGTYLWHAGSSSDKLFKLDTSGNVIDSFDSPGDYPQGLAFEGTYLWNADSNDDKIYKLDTSGNIIDSFDSPDSYPRGLAFDGTYLWHAGSSDDKIYKLDTSGNVIDSFDSPGSLPMGLAFDGTYLWHADATDDNIYKLDTSGNIIDSFDSPGSTPTGLTFDGIYLWNADFNDDKIYKLGVPPGPINVGSSAIRTFKVTNIGSANLVIGTFSITGADAPEFSIQNDNCSGRTLAPIETCTFDVVFSRASEGEKSAILEIPSNDPYTPILNVLLTCCDGYVPDIILTAPNGGEVIPSGSNYPIQWFARPEAVNFRVKYSMNNGKKWKLIAKDLTGTSYDWPVPTPANNKTKCLVKVIGYDDSGEKVGADKSNSTFTIVVAEVTSPNGGETLTSGIPYTIDWETYGTKKPMVKVILQYTKNGGKKWEKITTLADNTGTYDWTVPGVPKTKSKCLVKVVLKDAKGNTVGNDTSDSYFTIQP